MDTLSWIADVYGPRLTGSPTLRQAAEWARDQLTKWGFANAALEPSGIVEPRLVDRSLLDRDDRAAVHADHRLPARLVAGARLAASGTPIVVEVKSKDDFEKYRGKLRGAIVMNGRPELRDIGFQPEAKRLTDEELKKQEGQIDPAAPAFPNLSKSYWDEEDEFVKGLEKQKEIYEFFAKEGIAALVTPSAISENVRTDGFYDHAWHPTYPGFVFSREHYGRIVRMLDRKQPVKLSLTLAVKTVERVDGFNVVAEFPGTDAALQAEVVMLGGHLDSWHSGTGATDNGAGVAVALEAMRILKAIGVKPRRTIRIGLWSGEEQDYFGSMGYVERHFGTIKTMALKPEHAKLSGYFNLDNGSGRIRGVNLQGNEAARPIFEAWLRPFNYLGASTLTTLNTGGTDHMPFDAIGLARLPVHPGSAELRVEGPPLRPRRRRGGGAGGSEAGVGDSGELRVPRRDARRDAAAQAAAQTAHGREMTRGLRALALLLRTRPDGGACRRAVAAAGGAGSGGDLSAAAAADLAHQDLRSPRAPGFPDDRKWIRRRCRKACRRCG